MGRTTQESDIEPQYAQVFHFYISSRPDLWTTQIINWIWGGASFPLGVKLPGHEANNSPLTSVEDKKV
jgi:hypothetical protein